MNNRLNYALSAMGELVEQKEESLANKQSADHFKDFIDFMMNSYHHYYSQLDAMQALSSEPQPHQYSATVKPQQIDENLNRYLQPNSWDQFLTDHHITNQEAAKLLYNRLNIKTSGFAPDGKRDLLKKEIREGLHYWNYQSNPSFKNVIHAIKYIDEEFAAEILADAACKNADLYGYLRTKQFWFEDYKRHYRDIAKKKNLLLETIVKDDLKQFKKIISTPGGKLMAYDFLRPSDCPIDFRMVLLENCPNFINSVIPINPQKLFQNAAYLENADDAIRLLKAGKVDISKLDPPISIERVTDRRLMSELTYRKIQPDILASGYQSMNNEVITPGFIIEFLSRASQIETYIEGSKIDGQNVVHRAILQNEKPEIVSLYLKCWAVKKCKTDNGEDLLSFILKNQKYQYLEYFQRGNDYFEDELYHWFESNDNRWWDANHTDSYEQLLHVLLTLKWRSEESLERFVKLHQEKINQTQQNKEELTQRQQHSTKISVLLAEKTTEEKELPKILALLNPPQGCCKFFSSAKGNIAKLTETQKNLIIKVMSDTGYRFLIKDLTDTQLTYMRNLVIAALERRTRENQDRIKLCNILLNHFTSAAALKSEVTVFHYARQR